MSETTGGKNGDHTPVFGQLGTLTTRLARDADEIWQAQQLRYRVFFEEARRDGVVEVSGEEGIDSDRFDAHCDHLLVLDGDTIVGTYRLMTAKAAQSGCGFYSASEFDIDMLSRAHPGANLMELGRSCILPAWRTKRCMELLWAGTWAYALKQNADILFGCASLPGTGRDELAKPLALLGQTALLPAGTGCNPAPGVAPDDMVDLAECAKHVGAADFDSRAGMRQLPPLLKGYLRLGAKIASHAVVDREFGTIDVLVVLEVAKINPRYIAHYGIDATRYAKLHKA